MINKVLAQKSYDLGPPLEGIGTLGTKPFSAGTTITTLLSNVIGFLSIIGFLFFTFQIILAGYKLLGASGDKNKAAEAQQQLTQGIIGVIIIVAAVFVVAGFSKLIGINNILDIKDWIDKLRIK